MSPANIVTFSRLVVTPVFVAIFYLPDSFGKLWTTVALWALAAVAELSDWLDGFLARRDGSAGDFGKLFDPFADVVMHVSFFIVFCIAGALPLAFLLLVVYREFAITLVRQLAVKKGLVMGARKGGKIKTVSYVVTGSAALAKISMERLGIFPSVLPSMDIVIVVLCSISAVLAVISFADYLAQYRKLDRANAA